MQKPESGKTWKEVNKEHFEFVTHIIHVEKETNVHTSSLSKDYFQIPWIRKLHPDIIGFLTENRTWIGIIDRDCPL